MMDNKASARVFLGSAISMMHENNRAVNRLTASVSQQTLHRMSSSSFNVDVITLPHLLLNLYFVALCTRSVNRVAHLLKNQENDEAVGT